jgi:opacity protein-like surface antigen
LGLLHNGIEVRVDKHFRVNLRLSESSKAEDVEEIEANAFAAELSLRAGWTIGVGVEGVISGNWTAKVEYLYIDLQHIGVVRNALDCSKRSVRNQQLHVAHHRQHRARRHQPQVRWPGVAKY